jgi:hypothetical protein
MKLLKKIAPFAISTLMIGASMAGAAALNIADWKTQFSASNTAVVVGTGVTDAGDIAAALAAAKAAGIDTSSTTVTGESYKFEKTSDKLNVGNLLSTIKATITEDQMPAALADGTYKDASSSEYQYTQKITLGTALKLTHFADSDYNDKAPTLGINMTNNQHIMNYTLTFTDKPDFTDAILDTSTIDMMGKTYYISDVDTTANTMTLLDSSTSGMVKEGETITLGGEAITLYFVSSATTPTVKLKIGDTITNSMAAGATYKLSNGKYVGVKDIMYVAKDTGTSSAELTIGNGKIKVYDNYTAVKINEKTVEGLYSDIGLSAADLYTVTFIWDLADDAFVTQDSSITLPGLEAIKLMMTGITFPTGEEIDVEAGSSDTAAIKIPFKDGTKEVTLLHSNTTHFTAIGPDTDELLITTRERYLAFNKTANAKYFIASYEGTTDAESYYLSATFNNVDDKVTLKNEVTGSDVCTIITDGECSIGQVDLTAVTVSDNYANLSINAAGGHFDRVFTSKGELFFLPVNATGHGYLNLTVGANSPGSATWVLEMWDQDKDQNIERDSSLNITFGHNTDTDVHISAMVGASMFEQKDKYYVGYVESDLATKVEWDKTSDAYTAKVTYYGDEVYGNVFIAASGATGSSTSWTPVYDSETDKYVSKNIVVIGGTAVNKVARKMLGLDEATPVYGTDAGWADNTGVTGAGKGILWMKTSPYTEGTGKYALLVAGWSGSDTEKSANYLSLKASTATKEKVVIDTTALVEAS